jgi:hypothetical protein
VSIVPAVAGGWSISNAHLRSIKIR